MPELIDATLFAALLLWFAAGVKILADFIQYFIEGDKR